ncbi:trypsin-like peptidase domain-containing protein [Candidatus Njordibacter sp. Uisw_039]|uniref:trypsin-like peptidase domain-containing protein n=1 Tax=Candidatus Njordibacter sp. Uisw_039 TaxID=3230972 RepID=UPI003D538132
MNNISLKICLLIVALFGGVAGASDLPDCPAEGWRHNCFGTLTTNNSMKITYVGEWKDNKKNGQGTTTWGDDYSWAEYVGEYKDGKRNGKGVLTSNGNRYVGEWKDGRKHGQGSFTYKNGNKYVGQFKTGSKHGQGTLTYATGKIEKGIWSDNIFQYVKSCLDKVSLCSNTYVCSIAAPDVTNGKKAWFSSSSKYYKYTVEAKKRGLSCGVVSVAASLLPDCPSDTNVRWHNCFGTYTLADGGKYVGEYNDDYRNGQGTYTFGPESEWAGDVYVGEWKDNEKNGQGTYTHANGDKYVGEYKDDKRTGQGTYTWPNGDKYVGEYKDDKRTGQGTFTYSPNGESAGHKYVGEWKDDNYNGQGTYTHADGTVEEGIWKDDKLNGQATVTYADGTVEEGIWKDDEFQYAKAPTKPIPVVKTPTKPVPVVKVAPKDDEVLSASSGSGFAVSSDGYVITNNHVIEGCQDVVVHTKQEDIKMRVITYDIQNDLALLKGDFTPTSVFPLSTKRPELLQDIYVAGYPFGKNISTSVKVTKGIISSLTGIGNNFSNIQIDAALQSGNSGGPILDDMGNLVGVAVSKLDAKYMFENFGSIPENTNFGIKSSVVRSVLDSSSVDIPKANTSAISKSQLGKMITDGTYYISCWMTLAQIEKVRSKKVLFSELD